MSFDINDIERLHATSGDPPTSIWAAMGADDVGIVFLVGLTRVIEEVEQALQDEGSKMDLPIYTGLAVKVGGPSLDLKLLIFGAWDSQDEAQAIVREISEDAELGPADWAKKMCEIAHKYKGQNVIATSDLIVPAELLENIFELYLNECRRSMSN